MHLHPQKPSKSILENLSQLSINFDYFKSNYKNKAFFKIIQTFQQTFKKKTFSKNSNLKLREIAVKIRMREKTNVSLRMCRSLEKHLSFQ